ncbi:hypothetical protein SAMN05216360_11684 [Methylobacterium phyllostachyos]|uniref:Uncharacterized protein n=1 Tax=Methylobacterium phyllostachyos TaxID=582672 RepID=A0A1H0HMR8_9HYPH|nr:hypothetical protein SAMN05216360_11684 [Methylobacterium phyllostachyos]
MEAAPRVSLPSLRGSVAFEGGREGAATVRGVDRKGVASAGILWFRGTVCETRAALADLLGLSDAPWAVIAPFPPRDQPGPERKDDRRVIPGRQRAARHPGMARERVMPPMMGMAGQSIMGSRRSTAVPAT